MTVCKVLLFGLKPCDLSSSTNDQISESLSIKSTKENSSSPDNDYLNIDIKPLVTPTSSRSSINSDPNHESNPIHIMIRETSRGRHRICVSQTLLHTRTGDV